MAKLSKFKVKAEWKMYGFFSVEAADEKEAIRQLHAMFKDGNAAPPSNGKFLNGSIIVDHLSVEKIQ